MAAERVEEPVHRLDLLEALSPNGDIMDVHEMTAIEERECEDCGGQVVNRHYAVGDVPEYDGEVPEEHVVGRDPDEDALIADPSLENWHEAREIPGLDPGDLDE